jgi:hypothetical protein
MYRVLYAGMADALYFGIGFLAFLSIGFLLVFRASLFQKFYLARLSRFPRLASMFPIKGFIASGGYIWLIRFVGVIFLVISVAWFFGFLGAIE